MTGENECDPGPDVPRDTGATDSLVPRDALESIGLTPKAQRIYELADGSEIRMDITTGDIEFMGEIVGGTIILGEPGTEPILGVTALESVGIDVDPRNQTLKRLPAIRLKALKVYAQRTKHQTRGAFTEDPARQPVGVGGVR